MDALAVTGTPGTAPNQPAGSANIELPFAAMAAAMAVAASQKSAGLPIPGS